LVLIGLDAVKLSDRASSSIISIVVQPDCLTYTFPHLSIIMKKIIQTKTITTQTNGSAPVTHEESHSIEILDIHETTTGQPIKPRSAYSRYRASSASNFEESIPKLDDNDGFWTNSWKP
jgi:hypothetical protein